VILWSIHLIRNSNGQRKEDKKRRNPSLLPLRPRHALLGSLRAAHLPLAHPRAPASWLSAPTPTRPRPLLARLARACTLARHYRRHALRRCAPVGPHTCALRAPRLRSAVPVARVGGCPTLSLPWDPPAISLFPVFSPCSPTMHAPWPLHFLGFAQNRPQAAVAAPETTTSTAPSRLLYGYPGEFPRLSHPCLYMPGQPRRRCVAAWCVSWPTDQRARTRPCTQKRRYQRTRPRSRFVAVVRAQHVRVVSVYPLPAYSLSFVYPSLCLPPASPPWRGGPARLAWCRRCGSLRGLPTAAPTWPMRYPGEPASRMACPAAP
jgi:hypothetical protein